MKILFVLENFYPKIGGVETLFKDLTDELANKGHKITVLTNRSKNDNLLSSEELPSGVKIKRVAYGSRYIFTFFAWLQTIPLAKKHDIIHTTSYNAAIPAFIAAVFSRKKVLITFHEVWGKLWFSLPFFNKLSLSLHYIFEWFLLKLPFDLFIAVSEFTKNQLQLNGIKKEKILRIYNGLDYSKLEKRVAEPSNEIHNFLFYGRLGISKGLDILINGASKVSDDFKLILILPKTPVAFLNNIKKLISESTLKDKVVYHHELSFPELKKKIKAADTVIIPSYSEGFGFAATESIALGVPIISSDKGSLKEVVSGKFIKMKTFNEQGLKEAMEDALQGKYQETEIRKFHLTDAVSEYLNLYQSFNK